MATVRWRLIRPAKARGAAPNTSARSSAVGCGSRYQSTNAVMPACTISPIQERSCADSSRNHGISRSMRWRAVVLSRPTDCSSRSAICARLRGCVVVTRRLYCGWWGWGLGWAGLRFHHGMQRNPRLPR